MSFLTPMYSVSGGALLSLHFSEQNAEPKSNSVRSLLFKCFLWLGILLSHEAVLAGTSARLSRLPAQSTGTEAIVRTLISAFDQADVVALGEAHQSQPDSDLRIALVRNPDFAKKVHFIVVEFASTTEQATLDRFIRGENIPLTQLQKIWKTTTQAENGIWDSPVYLAFFEAVRDVNKRLSPEQRIRVLGGDPSPEDHRSREVAAVDVVREQVLQKRAKALIIYGAAHFYRAVPQDYLASMGEDTGIVNMLEKEDPGRILSVIRIGWLDRPRPVAVDVAPNFRKLDGAIKSPIRPVLISFEQPPFQDLSAEEFLGRTITTCRPPGGCRSAFKGSTLTLGQLADAGVYLGGSPEGAGRLGR